MKWKRQIYMGVSIAVVVLSLILSVPATVQAGVFLDNPPEGDFKKECRSWDVYTMIIAYSIFSSILFCLTFSFLFSLCILGSPLLRDTFDPDEHTQRWRLLLTLSLVNIFYIISGFLLNFKEVSRLLYKCCLITSLLEDTNNITYDVWNFVLLVGEPVSQWPMALFSTTTDFSLLADVPPPGVSHFLLHLPHQQRQRVLIALLHSQH